MKRRKLAPVIFTIPGVLTADECQQVIAPAEERGFDAAPSNAFNVGRLDRETRNNDEVIDHDLDLAQSLWSRVEGFVPRMLADRQVRGVNGRFRFYRYAPGQRLAWHWDGSFAGAHDDVMYGPADHPFGQQTLLTDAF